MTKFDEAIEEFIEEINADNAKKGSKEKLVYFNAFWGPNANELSKNELVDVLRESHNNPNKIPGLPKCKKPSVDVKEWIKQLEQ